MSRIPSHCWAQPLAQDYNEICRLPDPEVYSSAPSLARLRDLFARRPSMRSMATSCW